MALNKVNINCGGAQSLINNAALITDNQLNIGLMKPYLGKDGRTYVTVYNGGDPKNKKNYNTYAIPSNLLQTNGTLRRDEWKFLDTAVLEQSRKRLGGFQDLISAGLVMPLNNAMGTTVMEWHDSTGLIEADMTMDGISRGQNNRPKYQYNYMPIPILHGDFEINARELAASRRNGNPLDAQDAKDAARGIAEKLENLLFTDTTFSFGEKDERTRNTIYSYVNHPDRNTLSLTTKWDASGKTGAGIIDDVLKMKQASIADLHYGPTWNLYIPTDYETVLDNDYDATTPGTTIRERIMKIGGIAAIKISDTLAADTLLLIEMNTDTVRVVKGMDIQTVQWQVEGQFITKYKVWTIQVPQIRSDQNGHCGVVHATLT